MAKIVFPVSESYVRTWGLFEALREVLQNARDVVAMHGAMMSVKHYPRTGRLIIVTSGAAMDCRDLLLGRTSKMGDSRAAGQHGEGMKLALLVLSRLGHDVKIETGDEVWTAAIEEAEQFGGEKVLVVYTRKVSPKNEVTIEIGGIGSEWETMKPKFLFLGTTGTVVRTSYGSALFDPSYKGMLFVKGIFVCKMDDLSIGYDCLNIDLDRDRRLVDTWTAKYRTSEILAAAAHDDVSAAAQLYKNLKSDAVDGPNEVPYMNSETSDVLNDMFVAECGNDVLPVESEQQATRLRSLGGRAVVAPKGLCALVQRRVGNFDALVEKLSKRSRVSVDDSTLTKDEMGALTWAVDIMTKVLDEPIENISVYELADDHEGECDLSSGDIAIGRRCLSDCVKTLGVLIHELAHRETCEPDGSLRHVAQIEAYWASATRVMMEGRH